MRRKSIAVACQGGGSQCAFIAGALKELFAKDFHSRFKIVGLSGTSGGAFTAALAWAGMVREASGEHVDIGESIVACWRDLSAQTPQELVLDKVCLEVLRFVERGWLPSVASSPSSVPFLLWSQAVSSLVARPEFTDLRVLLEKHLDFQSLLPRVRREDPVLLVGAADVLEGSFKVFSSAKYEISLEALLASAAIPNLFPAVWVDGHAYWDGIFSSNPPVSGFLQRTLMGEGHLLPDEVWVIQINRAKHGEVPERPGDILDRRNHLAGNLSLQHELRFIEMVNLLAREGALTDAFRARFGIATTEPIVVRFLRMSDDLQRGLDYPSKLSRQPVHIERLIADGEAQAAKFLESMVEDRRASPASPDNVWGAH